MCLSWLQAEPPEEDLDVRGGGAAADDARIVKPGYESDDDEEGGSTKRWAGHHTTAFTPLVRCTILLLRRQHFQCFVLKVMEHVSLDLWCEGRTNGMEAESSAARLDSRMKKRSVQALRSSHLCRTTPTHRTGAGCLRWRTWQSRRPSWQT